MISKVVLAKLSPTMEEGTIVKWSKNEGDAVKVGDVLAEIETDKANMEMEAMGAGILRKILVPAGGKAPVGALIGVIADADEDIAAMVASAAAAPVPAKAEAAAPPPDAQAPAAAPLPEKPAVPAQGEVATAVPRPQPAPQAGTPAAPAPPPAQAPPRAAGERVKASPLARAIAAERNLALDRINGSGPGGRITKKDVEAFAAAPRGSTAAAPAGAVAQAAKPAPRPAAPTIVPGTAIPHTSMRKTIARRLAESAFTAPHFYVTVDIDMDAAVSLREQLARAEDVKLAYDALIVRACALALAQLSPGQRLMERRTDRHRGAG